MKVLEKDGLKYVLEGKGETILFFHGWGMSPRTYEKIIKRLALKYQVLGPFIKSFRDSSAEELINILNNNSKIIVVAHSAGGVPALEFCAKFPNKVKALVLIDTLGGGKSESVKPWSWVKEAGRYLFKPSKLTVTLFKGILCQITNAKKLLGDSDFILAYKTGLKHKFPVLILWGKEDSLIPLENGYNLNKILSEAQLETVSGKHFWLLEDPDMLMEKINEFIK